MTLADTPEPQRDLRTRVSDLNGLNTRLTWARSQHDVHGVQALECMMSKHLIDLTQIVLSSVPKDLSPLSGLQPLAYPFDHARKALQLQGGLDSLAPREVAEIFTANENALQRACNALAQPIQDHLHRERDQAQVSMEPSTYTEEGGRVGITLTAELGPFETPIYIVLQPCRRSGEIGWTAVSELITNGHDGATSFQMAEHRALGCGGVDTFAETFKLALEEIGADPDTLLAQQLFNEHLNALDTLVTDVLSATPPGLPVTEAGIYRSFQVPLAGGRSSDEGWILLINGNGWTDRLAAFMTKAELLSEINELIDEEIGGSAHTTRVSLHALSQADLERTAGYLLKARVKIQSFLPG